MCLATILLAGTVEAVAVERGPRGRPNRGPRKGRRGGKRGSGKKPSESTGDFLTDFATKMKAECEGTTDEITACEAAVDTYV